MYLFACIDIFVRKQRIINKIKNINYKSEEKKISISSICSSQNFLFFSLRVWMCLTIVEDNFLKNSFAGGSYWCSILCQTRILTHLLQALVPIKLNRSSWNYLRLVDDIFRLKNIRNSFLILGSREFYNAT